MMVMMMMTTTLIIDEVDDHSRCRKDVINHFEDD